MQGGLPKSCNSRPIPFSLRREVREQVEEMFKNDILEISHSPYVNPLTIIQRKDKPVRICGRREAGLQRGGTGQGENTTSS
jgi:hypothetical protein